MTLLLTSWKYTLMGLQFLRRGWPAIPIAAGWGALLFAVLQDGTKRFLGAIWGPVETSTVWQYSLRATRPTFPVAELTAVTVALMLRRQSLFEGEVLLGATVCTHSA